MSTFLTAFSVRLVRALRDRDLLQLVEDGSEVAVVRFLTDHLASSKEGQSLISRVVDGLVRCPAVDELYADDATVKEVVQDLGLTR